MNRSRLEFDEPFETFDVNGNATGVASRSRVHREGLEPIGDITHARLDLPEHGLKDYELQQSFRGVFDGELYPNASEVSEIDMLALPDLRAALEKRPHDFTPWLCTTLSRLEVV